MTVQWFDETVARPVNVSQSDPMPVTNTAGGAPVDENLVQLNGNTVDTGNGATTAGTLRVTMASDSTGIVGMSQATITTTMTRPSDTNVYASGDVISSSTSGGTNLTFANAARAAGGGGIIIGASISDSANQTIKAVLQLWLWAVAPAATNDNAAMALSDTENNNLVAVIDIDTLNIGNAAAGASGNVRYNATNPVREFVCDSGSTSLFGQIRVNNAYTPVSGEIFSVNLQISWR